MYTSIGPELSELTQRQAMTTGKRLSKSLRRCSIGMLLKADFEKNFIYQGILLELELENFRF